ncbi:MAG: hypothetical protein KME09_00180 [Pleurocapsa minor HA4230-MV1]|jgi:hypothetical protein|nr:hypothetical protein [Pleurocapsa minor HA4230-MV1]
MKIKYSLTIAVFSLVANIIPAMAENITVEDIKAQQEPITAGVVPGKSTPIVFKNNEIIDFVLLSDQSKNIYTPNAPIETGQARSLYVRQIQTLDLEGTTTNEYPNLFVETVDGEGNRQEYEFILNNNDSDRDRIFIEAAQPEPIPQPKPKPEPEVVNTVKTKFGDATPEDIKLGLDTSIAQDRIKRNEPLAVAIEEYIAQTMNGISTTEALEKTGIPLSVVQKLGTLGQQEDAKRRLLPLEPNGNFY